MEKIENNRFVKYLQSNNLEVLIFDFDGTLLDVNIPLEKSIQETFKEYDLDIDLDETKQEVGTALESIQGLPFPKIILRSYDIFNSISSIQQLTYLRKLKLATKLFTNYLDYEKDSHLFSKARDLLEQLSIKYHIYIISNNQSKNIDYHIKEKNIGKYFKGVYGADNLSCLKPDPLAFQPILNQYPLLERRKFAIIGDMPTDIEAGQRAGIWTIGITSGLSSKKLLDEKHPDLIIESLIDLRMLLL